MLDAYACRAANDPSLHLVVIGNGALHREVEAGIATRGLSKRVTLLGALSAANIARWLRAADLFVLSSAYEGMPIAVLEALACGLPVASTDRYTRGCEFHSFCSCVGQDKGRSPRLTWKIFCVLALSSFASAASVALVTAESPETVALGLG